MFNKTISFNKNLFLSYFIGVFISSLLVGGFFVFESYKKNIIQEFITTNESLIDLSKKSNQYSHLVSEEIKFFKNNNFALVRNDLKLIMKKLSKTNIKDYSLREISFEINEINKLNASIRGHLKDGEDELALKIYKTEFLFHKEKLINLIDSLKKALIVNFNKNISENKYELYLSLVVLSIFFFTIIFLLIQTNSNKQLRVLQNKIDGFNSQLDLKDTQNSELNLINKNINLKLESVEKNYFDLITEIDIKGDIFNNIKIEDKNFEGLEYDKKLINHLQEKLLVFINDFQSTYQKSQLFNMKLLANNKSIQTLKNLNDSLKTTLINMELGTIADNQQILTKISETIDSIDFNSVQFDIENLVNLIREIKTKVSEYEEYESSVFELNKKLLEQRDREIKYLQGKLIEMKNIFYTIKSVNKERESFEKFN